MQDELHDHDHGILPADLPGDLAVGDQSSTVDTADHGGGSVTDQMAVFGVPQRIEFWRIVLHFLWSGAMSWCVFCGGEKSGGASAARGTLGGVGVGAVCVGGIEKV